MPVRETQANPKSNRAEINVVQMREAKFDLSVISGCARSIRKTEDVDAHNGVSGNENQPVRSACKARRSSLIRGLGSGPVFGRQAFTFRFELPACGEDIPSPWRAHGAGIARAIDDVSEFFNVLP